MTEIDIWIKAFSLLGYKIEDEHCNRVTGYNYIYYSHPSDVDSKILVYFNFDTGEVTRITNVNTELKLKTKEEFLLEHKDIFREAKLNQLL